MSPAVVTSGPIRRLVVVRHGVTDHNARGIWQGHLDSPLSEDGLAQAEEAARELAAYDPDLIASSDLQRARVTAEIIAAACPGREVRIDPRLREIHVGQWQGLERAEMTERFPDAPTLLSGTEDFRRGVDGETYGELADRMHAACTDLFGDLPEGGTLFLITHGVSARALTGDLLGLDREASWGILEGLGNCHWAEMRETAPGTDRWRLVGWNLRTPPVDSRQGARFGAQTPRG